MAAHLEFQGATLHDVVIHDVRLGVWLAVQLGMLDIHVLLAVVLADDAEGLALAHVQRCLVEDRTADDVLAACWLNLIETYGRKHVPADI